MIKEIKAPEKVNWDTAATDPIIFLAGSIEMGTAEQWQKTTKDYLQKHLPGDAVLLNPRRDDWDSSWVQSIKNKQFKQQVNWELEGMERSDYTFMYFSPGTKSPITLLELGLHCPYPDNQTIVVCPDGFWRKGNVDVTCEYFNIPVFTKFTAALDELIRVISSEWGY